MLIHRCPKDEACVIILDRFLPHGSRIRVAEFGRMRGAGDDRRLGDGWSTKRFAEHPRVAEVWSVDQDVGTIDVCFHTIRPDALAKVRFLPALHDLMTASAPIDLIYIDGPDDPAVNLEALHAARGRMSLASIIAVDDFSFRSKPRMIAEEMAESHRSVIVGDAIVFLPKGFIFDTTWMVEESVGA
jgi:hypothetical protein